MFIEALFSPYDHQWCISLLKEIWGGELRAAVCLKNHLGENFSLIMVFIGLLPMFISWLLILLIVCVPTESVEHYENHSAFVSKFTSDGMFWAHFKVTAPATAFRFTPLHAAPRFWRCILVEIQKAGAEAVLKFLKAKSEKWCYYFWFVLMPELRALWSRCW